MKRKKNETLRSIKAVRAFAWELPDGLCRWAESESGFLLNHEPSSEAKMREVVILKRTDYIRLRRLAKGAKI